MQFSNFPSFVLLNIYFCCSQPAISCKFGQNFSSFWTQINYILNVSMFWNTVQHWFPRGSLSLKNALQNKIETRVPFHDRFLSFYSSSSSKTMWEHACLVEDKWQHALLYLLSSYFTSFLFFVCLFSFHFICTLFHTLLLPRLMFLTNVNLAHGHFFPNFITSTYLKLISHLYTHKHTPPFTYKRCKYQFPM